MKDYEYKVFVKNHTNKSGRPTLSIPQDDNINITICKTCLSEVGPGRHHDCQKSTKRENLAALIRNSSEGSKANVLAQSLKDIAETQGESVRGGTISLQSGSKTLPVKIGTQRTRPETTKFSHENLKNLGKRLNLSNNSIM